jgi:hypothetical protein
MSNYPSSTFLMTADQHRRQAGLLKEKRPDLARSHFDLADIIEARGPQPNEEGEYDLADLVAAPRASSR